MNWTSKDTEELRETEGTCDACIGSPMQTECSCIGGRAADEIERLQARVAELERESYVIRNDHGELGIMLEVTQEKVVALEAERAEMAGVLRRLVNRIDFLASTECNVTMRDEAMEWCRDWAARLERNGTDAKG